MGKHKKVLRPDLAFNRMDRSAPDKPGETVIVPARLTPEQKEWLDKRIEGRSYHIRQAVQMYIDGMSAGLS